MSNKTCIKVEPFWQEFRTIIPSQDLGARTVTSLAQDPSGLLYAGSVMGVSLFDGQRWYQTWQTDKGCPKAVGVICMKVDRKGRLWVGTSYGLYVKVENRWSRYAPDEGVFWKKEPVAGILPSHRVLALSEDSQGRMWIGTPRGVFFMNDQGISPLKGPEDLEIRSLLHDHKDRLWVGTLQGLWAYDGSWNGPILPRTTGHELPGREIRALAMSQDGSLWAGTNRGIGILSEDGSWQRICGEEGLPFENITSLSVGPDTEIWVGTTLGACRYDGERWHYYAGERWLPGDTVTAVLTSQADKAWIATSQGLSLIRKKRMTLRDKANEYEWVTFTRHHRMGWIATSHLKRPGDLSSNETVPSDNDGLWTGLYVAAESFRFAVTREEEARRNARECFHAMLKLEEMTDIEGFPTKAIIRRQDMSKEGGVWNVCQQYPGYAWKGDCSSDEIDGHLFAYSIYYDLAADEEEKELVRGIVRKIMDHIIRNNYTLVYLDGRPTRWGVWNPEALLGEAWGEERGLNSLEILSHLKAAHHITGDEKYEKEYLRLIRDYGYAENTVEQKIMVPQVVINHSDDELAFTAYYPLLRYEQDPSLRSLFVKSVERSWGYERPEGSPFFNFIYGGGVEAEDPDVANAVQYLKDVPLDLIAWSVQNSHRSDVQVDPVTGRFGETQGMRSLPPDEKPMGKWNSNPYQLDSASGGRSEEDGALFLLPYWMGRYHGYIKEE